MIQALFGQLLIGLINGSFYALLSLGLAIIFGLLERRELRARRAVHDGRLRRLDGGDVPRASGTGGRSCSRPLAIGLVGVGRRAACCSAACYGLDNLYGLLLTFGLTLVVEGLFHHAYGNSG